MSAMETEETTIAEAAADDDSIPATVASSAAKGSKKRARSPDGTGLQQQAVTAASAAAAAQLTFALGFSGLYSLLSAATITSANQSAGAGGSSSLPSKDQVRQAALKAVQECPPHVHLSKTDSAPQLKLVDDRRLHVKGGMRGYRMTRATHGFSNGNYYYEVLILDPPPIKDIVAGLPSNARLGKTLQAQLQKALQEDREGKEPSGPSFGGHVRLGWSMRTGDLQAPVGYDKWSFAIRDIGGSKIHCSKREDGWGGEDFGPGDVIGCAICLSDSKETTVQDLPLSSSVSNNNDDNKDGENQNADATTANGNNNNNNNNNSLNTGKGSHIRFFKNGAPMGRFIISKGKPQGGVAFAIPDGVYYPAISLYMGASVKFNPGPHFIYQPKKMPAGIKVKPISDHAKEPSPLDEVATKVQKEKPFRKPDMLQAFQELVKTEAQILCDAYSSHFEQHVNEIREERKKRSLPLTDLEEK